MYIASSWHELKKEKKIAVINVRFEKAESETFLLHYGNLKQIYSSKINLNKITSKSLFSLTKPNTNNTTVSSLHDRGIPHCFVYPIMVISTLGSLARTMHSANEIAR